jgi:lysyl-tRNA synthetase class 2
MIFSGPAEWIPRAVEMLGVAAAAAVAAIVLRPARAVLRRSSPALVQQLIRRHGADTLSYFKLRGDLVDLFTSDRRAFLSCKVEHGVMLVAGDPVGAPEALPELITDACSVADRSGLRLGVLGASEDFADLARGAGLRAMYVGDEAIVDTAGFSLTGRKIRKVRQSVTRVEREGYTFAVKEHAALTPADLDSLDAVSAEWRAGAPERGFSMALDSMRGSHLGDSLVAFARDANGDVRGFLHLVPAYGRAAMSLSAMRRHPDTPNGLMEFLVVRSIEALREREVAELSLNFAAFARWMHDPSTRLQRLLGRVVALLNPFFQIESLYRFNAKFGPEWQPRYLLFDGPAALPRTAFAALTAEGFVPRPGLRVAEAWRRRFPGRAPVPQPVAEPAGGHA